MNPPLTVPQRTPVRPKPITSRSTETRTIPIPMRLIRFANHLKEGAPYVAAGAKPREFIKDLMHHGNAIPQRVEQDVAKLLADGTLAASLLSQSRLAKNERELYEMLKDMQQKYELFSGMTYADTSGRLDAQAVIDARPDGIIYSNNSLPAKNPEYTLWWAGVEMMIECKHKTAEDGYTNDTKSPIHTSQIGKQTAGQTMKYMASHLLYTHRTHGFMLQITGPFARFIYYDRATIIVSAAFDYGIEPSVLLQFTLSFSHLTREDRGWDTTVTELMDDEADRFLQRFNNLGGLWKTKRLIRIMLPVSETKHRTFIAPSQPIANVRRLAGRATRCFQVIPEDNEDPDVKPMFLKDVWRFATTRKEGDYYRRIGNHPNVMSMHADGDLSLSSQGRQDTTLSIGFCHNHLKLTKFNLHHHYRLVLDEFARKLTEFTSSKEAVTAIRDAIKGLEALAALGILQRDISPNNIMICEKGGHSVGKVSDLDCAVDVREPGPRRQFRTGTWQFMSLAVLQQLDTPHTLEDDLESCLWVLFWLALRYMKNTYSANANKLQYYLKKIFESITEYADGEPPRGGDGKKECLIDLHYMRDFKVHNCAPLGLLIWRLRKLFKERYTRKDPEDPEEIVAPEPREPITAARVLELFNKALATDGWPADDAAKEQLPKHMIEAIDTYELGATSTLPSPTRPYHTDEPPMGRRGRSPIHGENNEEQDDAGPKRKRLRRFRNIVSEADRPE